MKLITVITISEGLVDSCEVFSNPEKAEEVFTEKAVALGADPTNMSEHLEDGYFTYSNASVCLVHPESKEKIYLLIHTHRYGDSTLLASLSEEPSQDDVIKYLGEEFEPGRDEEVTVTKMDVVSEDNFLKEIK